VRVALRWVLYCNLPRGRGLLSGRRCLTPSICCSAQTTLDAKVTELTKEVKQTKASLAAAQSAASAEKVGVCHPPPPHTHAHSRISVCRRLLPWGVRMQAALDSKVDALTKELAKVRRCARVLSSPNSVCHQPGWLHGRPV
jgi:hypothetical protein